jgi:glucose-1-phosphate cytidylyltransferase
MLTYGDGLADLDVSALLASHRRSGRLGTVTGVRPPSRYGELVVKDGQVRQFDEKPQLHEGMINGGFFVFERKFLEYLTADPTCVLERDPLERLTADGQLSVYQHTGFWQSMDTYRDYQLLNQLWDSGSAPWRR